MSIEQELIEVLNQLPAAIEKAVLDVLVLRHPGHANQKTHGNRFGAGQAKESLRRLKDDKGEREKYKARARKKTGKAAKPVRTPGKRSPKENPGWDVTGKLLGESQTGGQWGSKSPKISKVGKDLTKTHQDVLDKIGEGLDLGFVSNPLRYSKSLDRFSKKERDALVSLLNVGQLEARHTTAGGRDTYTLFKRKG